MHTHGKCSKQHPCPLLALAGTAAHRQEDGAEQPWGDLIPAPHCSHQLHCTCDPSLGTCCVSLLPSVTSMKVLLHSLPSSYLAIHSLVVVFLLKTLLAHEFTSLIFRLRHCRQKELTENHGEHIFLSQFPPYCSPDTTFLQPFQPPHTW